MRHYFGYDAEGSLVSVENYGPAGWPSTHRMDDPNCTETSVVSLRDRRAETSPEIVGWIPFDCACDASQGDLLQNCGCCNAKFGESFVDVSTKTLKSKPLRSVYVDNNLVNPRDVVSKTPGAVVPFKVVCPDISDGEVVKCIQRGQVDIYPEDEWDMVVTGGTTAEVSLTAPAQGTRGILHIYGKYIRPMSFALRGFGP